MVCILLMSAIVTVLILLLGMLIYAVIKDASKTPCKPPKELSKQQPEQLLNVKRTFPFWRYRHFR